MQDRMGIRRRRPPQPDKTPRGSPQINWQSHCPSEPSSVSLLPVWTGDSERTDGIWCACPPFFPSGSLQSTPFQRTNAGVNLSTFVGDAVLVRLSSWPQGPKFRFTLRLRIPPMPWSQHVRPCRVNLARPSHAPFQLDSSNVQTIWAFQRLQGQL